MRVPSNPAYPTFDETYDVGFVQWLKSTKDERKEWGRRRNAAAKLAEINQRIKANDVVASAALKRARNSDVRRALIEQHTEHDAKLKQQRKEWEAEQARYAANA